jgi:predicted RNA binding protein YcfA (HicA-like mRNA interferase family)
MTRLPRVTAAQIIRVLEKKGFALSRQSGSHMIFKNSAGRRVTVPFHAGKILHPKILKSIITDADIAPEELQTLL